MTDSSDRPRHEDVSLGATEFPFGLPGQPCEELASPVNAKVRQLHDLWLQKAANGGLPSKSDFTLTNMKSFVSCVYLVDIIGDAADFRIRLFGSNVSEMLGKDYTGTLLSETPEELNWRGEIYALAYRRKAPVFYLFELAPFGRETVITENGLFPIADKEGAFAHLLCISVDVKRRRPQL